MIDVLVIGAGPAGCVAATVLARAGARVRMLDRATFPRPKLCGDTVNPGTVALLRRLQVAGGLAARGLQIDGMAVTSASGVRVEARYPDGQHGVAIVRRDLDWLLVQDAVAAGVQFDPGIVVSRALVDGGKVAGVEIVCRSAGRALHAPVTIAADGRHSTIAFGLSLARHPRVPRRWAMGAYFEGVRHEQPAIGEMHIRAGRYVGVAAVPGGLTNVCLVKSPAGGEFGRRSPRDVFLDEVNGDRLLAGRLSGARLVSGPVVLGPLAVDAAPRHIDGLLLAGDAAGFIDPMTGDGLRLAMRGAELSASAALDALEHGWAGVGDRLDAARRRTLAPKWRFNRALRAVVGSAAAISASTIGAQVAPSLLRAVVRYAGDCA
jgi:flavin-dependent dehydrogenase